MWHLSIDFGIRPRSRIIIGYVLNLIAWKKKKNGYNFASVDKLMCDEKREREREREGLIT